MTTETEQIPVSEKDILEKYANVLNETKYDVDNLPTLDLKGRQGHTDYIDFLDPTDMCAPVMKFRDRFNRPGIALNIRGKLPGYQRFGDKNTKDMNIVLALFQRYTGNYQNWSYGWGHSDFDIEHAYNEYHNNNGHVGARIMACEGCPFVGCVIRTDLLKGILDGTDPLFAVQPQTEEIRGRTRAKKIKSENGRIETTTGRITTTTRRSSKIITIKFLRVNSLKNLF